MASSRGVRAWHWLPSILLGAGLACLLGGIALVRLTEGPRAAGPDFPPALTPPGARRISLTRAPPEPCYAHLVTAYEGLTADRAKAWAAALDLPCGDAACTRWSTDARTDPFWRRGDDEPDGLDSVTLTLDGGTLTVDWGDYLCAGPN